jgi:hypothetical protein
MRPQRPSWFGEGTSPAAKSVRLGDSTGLVRFAQSVPNLRSRLLIKPYLLGKPLPGRRRPVTAASREAGARNAPALTGWRWSGLLGPSRQGSLLLSQPQPALSAEAPFNAAVITHEAGDVLPDPLVEHGLPWHEAEAEATITAQCFDDGEPAAG